MKSGGSEGGEQALITGVGLVLFPFGFCLFLDLVQVTSAPYGWISGRMGRSGGGMRETTSMGLIFIPFLVGVMELFFDSKKKWIWGLAGIFLAVIFVEILSRVHFVLNMKMTSLFLVLGMLAAGAGLLACGYMVGSRLADQKADEPNQKDS
jgi:putative effector of murein hydrolase LrgA (UPF0299 family)